ncbi:MAG: hypothetical protein DRN27_08075, partial [Thermoplasmata archaeon]
QYIDDTKNILVLFVIFSIVFTLITSSTISLAKDDMIDSLESIQGNRLVFTENGLDTLFDIICPLTFSFTDGELDQDVPLNPEKNHSKIKLRDAMMMFAIDDVDVTIDSVNPFMGLNISFSDCFFYSRWHISFFDKLNLDLFRGDIFLTMPADKIEMKIIIEPYTADNSLYCSVISCDTNLNAESFKIDLDHFHFIPRFVVDDLAHAVLDKQIDKIVETIVEEINITFKLPEYTEGSYIIVTNNMSDIDISSGSFIAFYDTDIKPRLNNPPFDFDYYGIQNGSETLADMNGYDIRIDINDTTINQGLKAIADEGLLSYSMNIPLMGEIYSLDFQPLTAPSVFLDDPDKDYECVLDSNFTFSVHDTSHNYSIINFDFSIAINLEFLEKDGYFIFIDPLENVYFNITRLEILENNLNLNVSNIVSIINDYVVPVVNWLISQYKIVGEFTIDDNRFPHDVTLSLIDNGIQVGQRTISIGLKLEKDG